LLFWNIRTNRYESDTFVSLLASCQILDFCGSGELITSELTISVLITSELIISKLTFSVLITSGLTLSVLILAASRD
jgi:hypothetical protein